MSLLFDLLHATAAGLSAESCIKATIRTISEHLLQLVAAHTSYAKDSNNSSSNRADVIEALLGAFRGGYTSDLLCMCLCKDTANNATDHLEQAISAIYSSGVNGETPTEELSRAKAEYVSVLNENKHRFKMSASASWTVFLDPQNEERWWSNGAVVDEWFYESDAMSYCWTKYFDPRNERFWFFHEETEEWFWAL